MSRLKHVLLRVNILSHFLVSAMTVQIIPYACQKMAEYVWSVAIFLIIIIIIIIINSYKVSEFL
jgi:hypothetical protein